jgi:hypothetical protein
MPVTGVHERVKEGEKRLGRRTSLLTAGLAVSNARCGARRTPHGSVGVAMPSRAAN